MGEVETITINGKEYSSYREACERLGLNYNTVAVARRRKGKTWKEMILEYAEKQPRQVTYRGVTYKSTAELCEAYNLNYGVLITNKNALGLTVEEAVDYALSKKVFIDGVYYDSYAQACKALDININSVVKFVQKHKEYSMVDAIIRFKNLPKTDSGKFTAWGFTYRGVEYSSMSDACRKLGYNLSEARAIKNRTKKSNSEVLDIMAKKCAMRTGGTYNGVPFKSLSDVCVQEGVPASSVVVAMKTENLSVEDAVAKVREQINNKDFDAVIYGGKTYSSIDELAQVLNVNHDMLKTYMGYGYSCSDAIAILQREKTMFAK